jgi:hypothetical protein
MTSSAMHSTNSNSEFRQIDRAGDVIEIRFGDVNRGGYDTWISVALVEPPKKR